MGPKRKERREKGKGKRETVKKQSKERGRYDLYQKCYIGTRGRI